jgi:hypothetical protein
MEKLTTEIEKEFDDVVNKFFSSKNIEVERIQVNRHAMKIFIDLEFV